MVDNAGTRGAPVIYENNPTYANLVGRVEHVAREGVLTTDFTLIKAGALHRANGGYLILDARRILQQPFAYDALKRALQSGEVRIESPGEALSLITTISLEPEPVPLDVKVVLIGEPQLYYLLTQYDPDFEKLFKIAADLDGEIDRDGAEPLYARLVATLVKERALRPFDRSAVERVIEESARMTGDASKLSSKVEDIGDLVRESDYWAGQAEAPVVDREHVERAVGARIFRLDRLRERMQEMTLRDLIYIDTDGARVGQVNGLSVISLGNFMFGRPTRISARVQMGNGRVINVEREVDLSGPIHSKGVLILSAFLGARYARERPLSISASLVFEQSYSGVDGDSASSTELYALLSELAELPLKQSLAVTGSVNQHGVVQPIGGANEKIEGFYDLCNARGLTGEQGVMIPKSNVQHLMLRRDVVDAIAAGRFHVYPVSHIDEGIELLTGVQAGQRGRGREVSRGLGQRVGLEAARGDEREEPQVRRGRAAGRSGVDAGDSAAGVAAAFAAQASTRWTAAATAATRWTSAPAPPPGGPPPPPPSRHRRAATSTHADPGAEQPVTRGETHIRQVVVAFGASQVPREMLEAAADLAAALRAEVRALMVEESWLEQVAEHPVTAELYLGSRTIQPWDRDRLRLELRARAEQMRRTVRQLAERRGVRISFEVAQGEVPAVLEQARGAGILSTVVAWGRPAFPSTARSRLAQVEALRTSRGFTLMHREGRIDRLPLVLYYDASPSAVRALEIVADLHRGRRDEVRVLLPPSPAETAMGLVGEIDAWRRENGVRVVVHHLASIDESDVARALAPFRHSLLVLPAHAPLLRPGAGAAASALESTSAVLVVRA